MEVKAEYRITAKRVKFEVAYKTQFRPDQWQTNLTVSVPINNVAKIESTLDEMKSRVLELCKMKDVGINARISELNVGL
jgi:hypothetical protein